MKVKLVKAKKQEMVDFIVSLLGEDRRKQLNGMSKARLENVIINSGRAQDFNDYIDQSRWLDMLYDEDDRTIGF